MGVVAVGSSDGTCSVVLCPCNNWMIVSSLFSMVLVSGLLACIVVLATKKLATCAARL